MEEAPGLTAAHAKRTATSARLQRCQQMTHGVATDGFFHYSCSMQAHLHKLKRHHFPATHWGFVVMMVSCLVGCGAEPGSVLDESDTAAHSDSDTADEVVDASCGPDDTTIGNLSWTIDITPGCNHYLGSVHVPDSTEVNTFAQLSELRKINGSLTIFRPHVTVNLDALVHLEIIDGEFSYRMDNSGRHSLSGPPSLRDVGRLRIESNPELESLAGFAPKLRTVHGDVLIRHNPKLSPKEITNFLSRINVRGNVLIEGNGDGEQ